MPVDSAGDGLMDDDEDMPGTDPMNPDLRKEAMLSPQNRARQVQSKLIIQN